MLNYTHLIVPFLTALIVSLVLGRILIPILRARKLGQKILEIGPKWHKHKEGTPTFGGLLFMPATLAAAAVYFIFRDFLSVGNHNYTICGVYLRVLPESDYVTNRLLITLGMAVAFSLIGFADDYMKLFMKRNKGLSGKQKLVPMFVVAIIYMVLIVKFNGLNWSLTIPYISICLKYNLFIYVLMVFGIVYTVNAVNLTDGIDGLCGSVTTIIAVFILLIMPQIQRYDPINAVIAGFIGALLGFLYYNRPPAKVWMGDTGSFFLGGMVVGLTIIMEQPFILIIAGFVYMFEGLSVMIQVTSYKLTKKRVFKMAPFHHHLELCGWSENKIVAVFALATVILCTAAYFGYGQNILIFC